MASPSNPFIKRPLLLVLLLTFLAVMWVQWPRIQDPYQIEEDFRILYWMHRFDDLELFEQDPSIFSRITEIDIGSHKLIMDSGSPGFSWLFQAVNQIVPFLQFSKLLIFPLTLIAVAYMYGIGKKIGDTKTAVILSLTFLVLNLASSTSVSTTGGLQRSFIFPLLLGLIYHLMNRQYGATAIILILSGLIYPSAFVLGVVTTLLTLVDWQELKLRKIRIYWKGAVFLGIAIFIVLLTFVPAFSSQTDNQNDSSQVPSEFFQLFTAVGEGHILTNPLYQSGSRAQLFTIFPFIGRGGLAVRGISIIHIGLLAFFALLTALLVPKSISRIHPVLKQFFWAIWICYVAAWAGILIFSAFPLYLPSRYTEASLFLFFLIFVISNGQEAVQAFVNLLYKHRQIAMGITLVFACLLFIFTLALWPSSDESLAGLKTMRLLMATLSLTLILIAIYGLRQSVSKDKNAPPSPNPSRKKNPLLFAIILLLISIAYISFFQHPFFHPNDSERALFAYVESLPKDTTLSGAPRILSSIPLFSKRQVIFNCESPNFVPEIVQDSLNAYYASPDEREKIQSYCQNYNVDYWIIDARLFAEETRESLYCSFAPYDSELYPDLITKDDFFWETLPPNSAVFHKDHLSVVPCDSLDDIH